MPTTTEVTTYESGLNMEEHNALANTFNPFMDEVSTLVETAKGIEVADATDKAAMKKARETRISLKNIRVFVEKKRKALKEESLLKGRAIDGMANIIKYKIVPVEKELQEKEDFVRVAEEKRMARMAEERRAKLMEFEVDCQYMDLAKMPDDAFERLLGSSEAGYHARIAAEKAEKARQEEERIAKDKAEAADRAERERLAAENAKLEAEKKRIQEEKEAAELEAENLRQAQKARIIAEQQAIEDKLKAEEAAKEAARQAALHATDLDKVKQLERDICTLTIPELESTVATEWVKRVCGDLNSAVKELRALAKTISK